MHLFLCVYAVIYETCYLVKSYHQNSNASGVNSTCNSRISGLKFILIPSMKGCLKKNLMKKPAAARKRSACMTMRKVMKKKVGHQKIMKRPSSGGRKKEMARAAWRENKSKSCRLSRARQAAEKMSRKKQNVLSRARQAATNGLPLPKTKWPLYNNMAAAAYAAQAQSIKAMDRADSAHEAADSAHEAADEAKKEAAYARIMANEYSKGIVSLKEEVKTGLEALTEIRAQSERANSAHDIVAASAHAAADEAKKQAENACIMANAVKHELAHRLDTQTNPYPYIDYGKRTELINAWTQMTGGGADPNKREETIKEYQRCKEAAQAAMGVEAEGKGKGKEERLDTDDR